MNVPTNLRTGPWHNRRGRRAVQPQVQPNGQPARRDRHRCGFSQGSPSGRIVAVFADNVTKIALSPIVGAIDKHGSRMKSGSIPYKSCEFCQNTCKSAMRYAVVMRRHCASSSLWGYYLRIRDLSYRDSGWKLDGQYLRFNSQAYEFRPAPSSCGHGVVSRGVKVRSPQSVSW